MPRCVREGGGKEGGRSGGREEEGIGGEEGRGGEHPGTRPMRRGLIDFVVEHEKDAGRASERAIRGAGERERASESAREGKKKGLVGCWRMKGAV